MALSSIWRENKILKRWIKKNYKDLIDGNYNYDMTNLLSDPLLEEIGKKLNVDKQYIYLGAGSSQLITSILNLTIWNRIIITNTEFGLYTRIVENSKDNKIVIPCVSFDDFIRELEQIKSDKQDLLCFSSPRWLSGEIMTETQFQKILKVYKGCILIDEAYISFSSNPQGFLKNTLKNDRIILLRSLSDKYFIPGLRVGYMITKMKINGLRDTYIAPHSISTFSARFMIKLLQDEKLVQLFEESIDYIKEIREVLLKEIKKDEDYRIVHSEANFITLLFKSEKKGNQYFEILKDLPGIQFYNKNKITFIKIWISNKIVTTEIIKRINAI